jgi:hypothetical protein
MKHVTNFPLPFASLPSIPIFYPTSLERQYMYIGFPVSPQSFEDMIRNVHRCVGAANAMREGDGDNRFLFKRTYSLLLSLTGSIKKTN